MVDLGGWRTSRLQFWLQLHFFKRQCVEDASGSYARREAHHAEGTVRYQPRIMTWTGAGLVWSGLVNAKCDARWKEDCL